MKNFIPYFIVDKYLSAENKGSFVAATMFFGYFGLHSND